MQKGLIRVKNDIYSLGVSWYVLLYHHFPQEKHIHSLDDVWIWKCLEEKGFSTMREILQIKGNGKESYYRRKYMLIGIVCFALLILQVSIVIWNSQQKEKLYYEAMSVQNYEGAMLYKTTLEPYMLQFQKVFDEWENQKNVEDEKERAWIAQKEALLSIETDIRKYNAFQNEEIASFYAKQCLNSENAYFYPKALEALTYVDDDENIIAIYRAIAKILNENVYIRKSKVQELQNDLKYLEQWCDTLTDEALRYQRYHLLLCIYENQMTWMKEDAFGPMIHILEKMQNLDHVNDEQLALITNEQAFIYYNWGMLVLAKEDHEKMQDMFIKAITLYQKAKTTDTILRHLADMKFFLFTYAYDDEIKHEHLDLLEQALNDVSKIEKMQDEDTSRIQRIQNSFKIWN